MLNLEDLCDSDLEDQLDDNKVADDESAANEAETAAGDILLKFLEKEVKVFLQRPNFKRLIAAGRLRCPFCPFRTWKAQLSSRMLDHIRKYHAAKQQFVASGTKQVKLIIAMHDEDKLLGKATGSTYLSRSADLLRARVEPRLSDTVNHVDRHIRLVFTTSGPEYWHLKKTIEQPLRRVRDRYYTQGFAQLLFQLCLTHDAKAFCEKFKRSFRESWA